MTAAERILAKALAASPMKSADWSSVQAGLRDRAFFSSTVDDARRVAAMRDACAKVAAGELSDSDARAAIRRALEQTGYAPEAGKEGGLQDLSSQRRLDLVLKTNVDEAHGYVRYCASMDPDALAATPCQELIRLQSRKAPRDWKARWREAGGQLYGNRMIALKTDPIWTDISAFSHPWPPFDFNSGMGVAPVGRREAIRYGVISPDDPPPVPKMPSFNDGLSAPLPKGAGKPMQDFLQDRLGDQVSVQRGMIHFNANLIRDMFNGRGELNAQLGKGAFNPKLLDRIPDESAKSLAAAKALTITRQWMATHAKKHEKPSGEGGKNLPLRLGDFELVPALWRQPDAVTVSGDGRLELMLDTLDEGTLFLGVDLYKGQALTFQKRRREP